jgi:hypothetical protein
MAAIRDVYQFNKQVAADVYFKTNKAEALKARKFPLRRPRLAIEQFIEKSI